jgi:hypothetical protein
MELSGCGFELLGRDLERPWPEFPPSQSGLRILPQVQPRVLAARLGLAFGRSQHPKHTDTFPGRILALRKAKRTCASLEEHSF